MRRQHASWDIDHIMFLENEILGALDADLLRLYARLSDLLDNKGKRDSLRAPAGKRVCSGGP